MFDIKKLRENKGLTQQELAEKCGVTVRTVQNWEAGKKIPESAVRLLQGIGGETSSYSSLLNSSSVKQTDEVIMIPVLNLDARGGFLANECAEEQEYTTNYMPFSREVAKNGDIVIPVYGDSMTPKYPSGSMILIRHIPAWREFIEFGAAYVIELTDERRLIKNIQRGRDEDTFLLESVNPKYEAADIPKKLIRSVFRVVMVVRRESL